MASRYDIFDRSRIVTLPLARRTHDVHVGRLFRLDEQPLPFDHPDLSALAQALRDAKARPASTVMFMGAHVIKQGLSRFVIDLIRRGWISALAVNGACVIHDYELARVGATAESVARYIKDGRFGLWTETGEINDIVTDAAAQGLGLGEAVGKAILQSKYPHKDVSILAAAYECGVPVTVHVGVGYDIVHEHPNCDGAAVGQTSYRDFLILARIIEDLEGGAVLCYGTAVMGPEVYLKALAMARNVAQQQGRQIRAITSAVFDLLPLEGDLRNEAPKDSPEYYYRPYKTVLVRTVRDGGRSFYFCGDHKATLPTLHKLLAT